jgi:hypothetical protein
MHPAAIGRRKKCTPPRDAPPGPLRRRIFKIIQISNPEAKMCLAKLMSPFFSKTTTPTPNINAENSVTIINCVERYAAKTNHTIDREITNPDEI